MRKYRVWDKLNKKFLESFFVDVVKGFSSDNFIIQGSYGILDINGKDIYEGDYIEHDVPQHYTPSEYDDLRRNGLKPQINVFLDKHYRHDFENPNVIGNIFENPELAKETFSYSGNIRGTKE